MDIVRLNDDNKNKYINQLTEILEGASTRLSTSAIECLVALEGDVTEGFIVIDFSDGTFPMIDCIYVVPDRRYSGIGKALLDAAELMCIASGYHNLSFVSHCRLSTKKNIFGHNVSQLMSFFENNGYFLTAVDLPPEEDLSIIRGNKVFYI